MEPISYADPLCGKDEEDVRLVDVEDVYLGLNRSIQCSLRQKLSLMAKDDLVGEKLHK